MTAPDPRLAGILSAALQEAFKAIGRGEMKGDSLAVCDWISPKVQEWYEAENRPVGYCIAQIGEEGHYRILDEGDDLADLEKRSTALEYWQSQFPTGEVTVLRLVRS